jgi:hypothetical protein
MPTRGRKYRHARQARTLVIAIMRACLLVMSHSQLSLAANYPDGFSAVLPSLYNKILGFCITVAKLVKVYIRDFDLFCVTHFNNIVSAFREMVLSNWDETTWLANCLMPLFCCVSDHSQFAHSLSH